MYIKRIKVENFRGIKKMDWILENKLLCLIGSSDSTKTTILDAIEFALYPYWNLNITNTDFYECNTKNPILIQLTLGDLPEEFINENAYGLYIRKFVEDDSNDEPEEADDIFLTIQLSISEFFEPEWKVITNRNMEKPISHKDRAKLSIARIGENIDKDFYIGRNSILKSYIDDTKELNSQLFDILQSVNRQNIDTTSITTAFSSIKKVIDDYNIKLNSQLGLEIEMKNFDLNISNIGISDGLIPLNKKGTGTKRLLSSILNLEGDNNKNCILIDEIEHGLEPYRIADLLYKLKTKNRQSIITTHSTIPITELDYHNLFICRSENGETKCLKIPEEFQGLLRKFPYAFLSKKILITEGATEWGIIRKFNKIWNNENFSLAYSSGIVVDGHGGSGTITKAKQFKKLGYDVAIFIDGDDSTTNGQANELQDIKVFKLKDKYNTEKRILEDIKFGNLKKLINIMVQIKDEVLVKKYMEEFFGISTLDLDDVKDSFQEKDIKDKLYNILIKKNSKKEDIFKGTTYGEYLGELIYDLSTTDLKDSEIITLLNEVRVWCNGI